MPDPRVNYDPIASTYHRRYTANALHGVATCLRAFVERINAQDVLETGCGTGRWIGLLQPLAAHVTGLDLSMNMLRQAQDRAAGARLLCGEAGDLPFPARAFDLVVCVNALHHFTHPDRFVEGALRVLRPGGGLVVVGMDPHRGRDQWYLYDYFEGTCLADLRRFPSSGQILDWMAEAGFRQVEWGIAERIYHPQSGAGVLEDPFLVKKGTSQLILLSDQEYANGMLKIKDALARAEENDEPIQFPVDLELCYLFGQV